MKIGVFICHCGSNIAGTVDCGKVAEIAKTYPDVAFSTDTMYTCSEPGQEEIVAAIKEHKLDGVVVASCTPRMHEPTFRRTVERAGLNKYMFEMANIREHVSWIGKDKEANTNKAAELVRIAVEKLRRDNPLFSKSFESTKRVLVIGGGVAGIQAALDCADAGSSWNAKATSAARWRSSTRPSLPSTAPAASSAPRWSTSPSIPKSRSWPLPK